MSSTPDAEINDAVASLRQAAWNLEPISLSAVNQVAALQTRVDHTFLVPAEAMREIGERLQGKFKALEINDERLMKYESTYFDTPELSLFRAHRQGRRQRYKVRTRRYVETNARFTEIKIKGNRGETIKFRQPRTNDQAMDHLGVEGHQFLRGVVSKHYEQGLPALVPVLESHYRRATLVDPEGGERLTCDVELEWHSETESVPGSDMVLLETKTTGRGFMDKLLAHMGYRPLSMSKYAAGTALLNPELAAGKWSRLLRQQYGWKPENVA